MTTSKLCNGCHGEGVIENYTCRVCAGTGVREPCVHGRYEEHGGNSDLQPCPGGARRSTSGPLIDWIITYRAWRSLPWWRRLLTKNPLKKMPP